MRKSRVGSRLRRIVVDRAQARCEYCQTPARISPDPFSVEHILPSSNQGATEVDNLALSCQGCNSYKHTFTSAFDAATGIMAPLFHPRRDKWSEHFAWSNGYREIRGTTAIGRATIVRLRLNRVELVNLRSILVAVGAHPPEETE